MSKYYNYYTFLTPFFDILTEKDLFNREKRISFRCKKNGHINELSIASFGNKKSKVKIEEFCTKCVELEKDKEKKITLNKIY